MQAAVAQSLLVAPTEVHRPATPPRSPAPGRGRDSRHRSRDSAASAVARCRRCQRRRFGDDRRAASANDASPEPSLRRAGEFGVAEPKGLPRDALPPQAAHHSDPRTMAPKDMKTCNACICCYQALDFADIKLLCVSEGEQCCVFSKTCLAAGEDVLGPGLIEADKDKGEICHLGLVVCSYGLKTPAVCCKSRQSCLCVKAAAALPFDDDFVPGPVCAGIPCPGFQLMPQAGCLVPPYSQVAGNDHKDRREFWRAGGERPDARLNRRLPPRRPQFAAGRRALVEADPPPSARARPSPRRPRTYEARVSICAVPGSWVGLGPRAAHADSCRRTFAVSLTIFI